MTQTTQKIGLASAIAIIVSNTIGSGIFTTTGFLARDIGNPILILGLWVLGGIIALSGAVSYGYLAAKHPQSGGEYIFIKERFSELPAFLSGWTSLLIGFSASIAAAAIAFSEYFLAISEWHFIDTRMIALALIWSISFLHLDSTKQSQNIQMFLSLLKLGFISSLFLCAYWLGEQNTIGSWAYLNSSSALPETKGAFFEGSSAQAYLIGLVFILYTYSGWNAVIYISDEVKNAKVNINRALIIGCSIVIIFYLGINLIYFYALPIEKLAQAPVLPVADKVISQLLGEQSSKVLSFVLCISIAGSISAMTWVAPRLYQQMALDGLLPKIISKSTKLGQPNNATLLQSTWCSVLILSGSFEQLVLYCGSAIILFSLISVLGIYNKGKPKDITKLVHLSALTYCGTCIIILLGLISYQTEQFLLSLVSVLVAVPIYYLAKSTKQIAR